MVDLIGVYEPELIYKIIILGDSAVGKTCFLLQYSSDDFKMHHSVTIGIDFREKILECRKKLVKLE